MTIEVKSSAYLQTWEQRSTSSVGFDIRPTIGWTENEGFGNIRRRQADIYVFALLAHKDKATVDPTELSQWEFYVLPTKTLNEKFPNQKRLSLGSLQRLECGPFAFASLRAAVEAVLPIPPEVHP